MNYFDRYIMIHSDSFDDERSRTHEYQIVAVAALFLAIKIHATSCEVENIQEVRAQALSKILYGTVKQQDIFVMEMNMLIMLQSSVLPICLKSDLVIGHATILEFITYLTNFICI